MHLAGSSGGHSVKMIRWPICHLQVFDPRNQIIRHTKYDHHHKDQKLLIQFKFVDRHSDK